VILCVCLLSARIIDLNHHSQPICHILIAIIQNSLSRKHIWRLTCSGLLQGYLVSSPHPGVYQHRWAGALVSPRRRWRAARFPVTLRAASSLGSPPQAPVSGLSTRDVWYRVFWDRVDSSSRPCGAGSPVGHTGRGNPRVAEVNNGRVQGRSAAQSHLPCLPRTPAGLSVALGVVRPAASKDPGGSLTPKHTPLSRFAK
jgi:hypothetical protein